MKKTTKDDTAVLDLIKQIQIQLTGLDKKVDTLLSPKPAGDVNRRVMHTAICADCSKECTIPFKPSADRPVYCQDCFSRRKVISLSGMKVEEPPAKTKKKKAAPKKK